MDCRERVFLALNHEEPDRVPVDFWASAGSWDIITRMSGMTREAFLGEHDVDFRYIDGPLYTGTALEADTDIWGVRRRRAVVRTPYGSEVYSEVAQSPLEGLSSVEEIEGYQGWPDADDFDYSVVKDQAEAVREDGRVVVFMGDRLNRIAQLKPAMYLRGVERILLDFAVEPEIAGAVFSRIRRFYTEYLRRILDAAEGRIDIVLTGDDFGQQTGLLIGPEMWNTYLSQGFTEYMEIIHSYGVKSMHHSCGDVRLLAARLHELGLDILQSLQPEAMGDGCRDLKTELGRTMSFHGGVSIQRVMPRGGVADIEQEVRERVMTFAPGGGYILGTAHNIQADCPYGNIVELFRAYRRYGRYPLG